LSSFRSAAKEFAVVVAVEVAVEVPVTRFAISQEGEGIPLHPSFSIANRS
jgi:hypothetical protein